YLYVVIILLAGFWAFVVKKSLFLVCFGVLCFACGGCAPPRPPPPSLSAMPGRGEADEAFQRDDQYCQSSAQQAIGYQSPGEAANQTRCRWHRSRRDRRCRSPKLLNRRYGILS